MKRLIITLSLSLVGCLFTQTKDQTNNFSAIQVSDVMSQVYKDPDADTSSYQTFTVSRLASTPQGIDINEIVEKQILFMVRNHLEALGFSYTDKKEEADFFVVVRFDNDYKESYIPPASVTIPWYTGGGVAQGSSSLFGFGSSGTFSGTGTSTTYYPGYWMPLTINRPGYTVGYYYPTVSISLIDSKTLNTVWEGSGIGVSNNHDIRLSSQAIIFDIFAKEGESLSCKKPWHPKKQEGQLGIIAFPHTIDGNNFYLAIFDIGRDTPAHKARLRYSDLILEINGRSTQNKSFYELLTFGKKGDLITLKIRRGNEIFNVTLKYAEPRMYKLIYSDRK